MMESTLKQDWVLTFLSLVVPEMGSVNILPEWLR